MPTVQAASVATKIKGWILVVEDETELATLLTQKFERAGYRALSCGKAVDAVRMMANQKFDVILTDFQLIAGDANQVIQAARKDDRALNYTTPILVVSALLNSEFIKKHAAHIASAFVKPVEPDQILAKVEQLCGQAVKSPGNRRLEKS